MPVRSKAQQIGGYVFATVVGLSVAVFAYQRASDPTPSIEREREERMVGQASAYVREIVTEPAGSTLEVVDPVHPNRVAGKTYIYPTSSGWEVSGYYRRDEDGPWHPWLMHLSVDGELVSLSLRDSAASLARRSEQDPRITIRTD